MTPLAAAVLLAEVARKAPKGGEAVKSGPWGLAIVLLLCVAAYFLFKSMSKHLKKVREEFPADRPAERRDRSVGDGGPGSSAPFPADTGSERDGPPA